MRVLGFGLLALAVLGAQTVVNPPQSGNEQYSMFGVFATATGALVYVVKMLYKDNRDQVEESRRDARENRAAMQTVVEQYASLATKLTILMDRNTELMDRIEEQKH